MSNWNFKNKDLGTLNLGKRVIIEYKLLNRNLNVYSISASCGCTKPKYNKTTNILSVSYKPKSIPHHLISQGWYKTTKRITVIYDTGEKEILTFKAKITK